MCVCVCVCMLAPSNLIAFICCCNWLVTNWVSFWYLSRLFLLNNDCLYNNHPPSPRLPSSPHLHQASHGPDRSVRRGCVLRVPGQRRPQAQSHLEQEGEAGELPSSGGKAHTQPPYSQQYRCYIGVIYVSYRCYGCGI